MKLKTGMEPLSWMSFNNTRGLPFHGMGAFIGTGKAQRAHVYTAASIPVDPEAYKKIDPKKLADELEVDMCAVNSGRFWMMDEVDYVHANGDGDSRAADGNPDNLSALRDVVADLQQRVRCGVRRANRDHGERCQRRRNSIGGPARGLLQRDFD